ncbi:O-antigen ligase family protein [Blastochloris sulfoviridis]|uniref:O-antigen ligase domain-containing protein n=1 Tax=Blastochloris sulfoviridis TaxID=50712 RepID=A0A5M6HUP2_9HYPH|nr:O-antigen ligase family protein [Blastochloris sulfoviridis]KAA5599571.1 O-antigen ligase domain-containing protein [Blastochloris sulfoviridis]
MSICADALPSIAAPRRRERVRPFLLLLAGLAGAFVFIEPSPYEIVSLVTFTAFVAAGLTLNAAYIPLLLLVIVYNVGFTLSLLQVLGEDKTGMWVAVSWYLGVTAIGFALVMAEETSRRLRFLLAGVMIGAVIAAACGIAGYFGVLADLFTRYGRARGTFNDPNVFGPFLVLPAVLCVQRSLAGNLGTIVRNVAVLAVLLLGLVLSFSRGSWFMFAASATIAVLLSLVTARATAERARIILLAGIGVVFVGALVVAALSVDEVGTLFRERASLTQSYDSGPLGRFGRHILGALLALDHPLGIGPRQFHLYFVEDPHNVYLNAFLSGGWISGLAYALLVLITTGFGFATVLRPTPWQGAYIAIYSTFLGMAMLGFVIDSDHWRLFWMLLGLVWGLTIATRAQAPPPPPSGNRLTPASGAGR